MRGRKVCVRESDRDSQTEGVRAREVGHVRGDNHIVQQGCVNVPIGGVDEP